MSKDQKAAVSAFIFAAAIWAFAVPGDQWFEEVQAQRAAEELERQAEIARKAARREGGKRNAPARAREIGR